jgi:flagellar motor switch protein FliN
MSHAKVTPHDALTRLGSETAQAVAELLSGFVPERVEHGDPSVLSDTALAFSNLPAGCIAASVSYVDGVTGANVFVMTPKGARALAVAMGLPPTADEGGDGPIVLSELELSAVSEAANQMMATAASTTGRVIGMEIEISPPDTQTLAVPENAADIYGSAPHATSTSFSVAGEPCRMIQLVPSAFVVRLVSAMDEERMMESGEIIDAPVDSIYTGEGSVQLDGALGEIHMRVSAELGRADITLSQALSLPLGAVVDLDCGANDPINLYVNGLCFAGGHLLVTDDGEWAVRLESVRGPSPLGILEPGSHPETQPQGAVT